MRVPSFLHGRFAEVSRSAKGAAHELQRGAHLVDVVDSWVDLRDLPGLIVLDGPSKLLGGSLHFHAFALMRAVADSLLPLTEASCHGTIQRLLEAGKRDEAATILAQTSFDDFVLCSLAEHFARAGETATAVAVLRRHAERGDPHGLLSTWIAEHGDGHGPVAVSDVREAFLRRPDLAAWTRLKQVGIAANAEDALEELARRGKPEMVMWARVWDGDGERALAAWEAMWAGRAADRVSLGFAARSVAPLVASSRPARAAELHVVAASTMVGLKKPSAYREAAEHLRSACDAYRAAGAPERAQTTIAEFRSEHRRLRRLMTILDEVGLK